MSRHASLGRGAVTSLWLGLAACGGSHGAPGPVPTATAATPAPGQSLAARLLVAGLAHPLDLQAVPGDRERLYVVEQGGRIVVLRNGRLQAAPFVDLSGRLASGGERGLLGLAFHPQFESNRRFFVNYTNPRGDTHVAEFRALSSDTADPASERVLLTVAQPYPNHNGGGLTFDSSGRLLVGLGDGGSGGDPQGHGQRLDTLLGKILRLDVDGGAPYAIPPDNPFRTRSGALPEIWAYGLRNPWRIAVDRATGDLYIGDVGQSRVEEIDVGLAARGGGENYGWNVTEGSECYQPQSGCVRDGLTLPVHEYRHEEGCSVTGGLVYRGRGLPGLQGHYFFSDFCTGFVRSFRLERGRAVELRDWSAGLRGLDAPSSFGVDADGELHVVDWDGEVYRLEPAR